MESREGSRKGVFRYPKHRGGFAQQQGQRMFGLCPLEYDRWQLRLRALEPCPISDCRPVGHGSRLAAQLPSVVLQRTQSEHALALLVGQPASMFRIPEHALSTAPPLIHRGCPRVAGRKPDVSAAENGGWRRRTPVSASPSCLLSNRQLNGLAGFGKSQCRLAVQWSSAWCCGTTITLPIFRGRTTPRRSAIGRGDL